MDLGWDQSVVSNLSKLISAGLFHFPLFVVTFPLRSKLSPLLSYHSWGHRTQTVVFFPHWNQPTSPLSSFQNLKRSGIRVPVVAQLLTNPTRNHEVSGSVPCKVYFYFINTKINMPEEQFISYIAQSEEKN